MLGAVTRKLGRETGERTALFRDLVGALIFNGKIETTLAKAKETKKIADGVIDRALANDVHARRQVKRLIQDDKIIRKLFTEVVPRYQRGRGGYTRLVRSRVRRGDAAEMAIVELLP